jgi:2,4-dienoyl-CoA reductase-like NADH-dependent reductase (Old Yellow Enzyme family)
MEGGMARLFEQIRFRDLTIPNRTMVSPMCMYSAKEGFANDFHLVHLGKFALGGWGIVMVEATAVERRGRITHGDVGLWSDEHIAPLSRIASFLKEHGAVPAIQLAHAGRKAGTQRPWEGDGPLTPAQFAVGELPWDTVAPSPVPFAEGWTKPAELSIDELGQIKEHFRDAVRRAHVAGFEIIEMHAAHGYLLNSFLSPLTNLRTDEYGGSREARFRFPLEVAEAMRNEWPSHLPMFVRVSAVDYVDGGVTIEDTVEFSKHLKAIGVDLVDCSSGGVSPKGIPPSAYGFQVPFAERVRRSAEIPTAAVGLLRWPEQAEQVIAEGLADLVAIARQALIDPNWPLSAREALEEKEHDRFVGWPTQYQVWLSKRQRVLHKLDNPVSAGELTTAG